MVKQAILERCRYFRSGHILSVQFKLIKSQRKSADRSWGLSTTEDLGLEGLSFYTDREYCVGDILDIHVIMSGISDVYRGHGKVVCTDRRQLGVYFLVAVEFTEQEQVNRVSRKNRLVNRSRIPVRIWFNSFNWKDY